MAPEKIFKDLRYFEVPQATEEAIRVYKKRVDGDPKNPASFYRLGRAYQAKGRKLSAYNAYKNALQLKPDFHPARYAIANIYASIGKLNLAVKEYIRILRTNPDVLEALFNLGLCYEKGKHFAKAKATWEAYLAQETDKSWREEAQKHLDLCREKP